MNDIIYGLVLGIVQGIGEFLPISSSGHLELAKYFFNDKSLGEESLLLSIVLHIGTALSTLWVFKEDIFNLFKGILSPKMNEEKYFALKIILSMIPAAFIGIFFEDQMTAFFENKIQYVCLFLIFTALILFYASRSSNNSSPLNFKNSFFIGLAQAVALLPGISRAGSTIAAAVVLGIDKREAAKFSFLMVLPLIFGKMGKDVLDGKFESTDMNYTVAIVGAITSFIVGVFACKFMIEIVRKSKLNYFAIYCAIVGTLGLFYFYVLK
jgi:undecaprenyl-diphosphatase